MSNIRSEMAGGRPNARNTLGLGAQAYESLLSKLDERGDDSEVAPQRLHTRIPFMDPFVRVQIEADNSGRREMILACRNISRGGVGLLHSSFMYPNTPVVVHLTRTDGAAPGVRGRVVRVQHRGGVVHEIGIKFDKEINHRDYVASNVTDMLPSFERVSPEKLSGPVVLVTSDEKIRMSAREHLLESELTVRFVASAEESLAEAEKHPSLMLIDIGLEPVSGPELVKKLRTRGYARPVVLVGDPTDDLTRSLVRVCGADALLRTPLTPDALLRTLGEFLLSGWDIEHLDKARSRVDRGTLVSLCFELSKLGVVMDQHVRRDDRVGMFGTCQKIAQMALMIGMNGVASMAERLGERIAEDAGPIEELVEQVRLGCAAAGRAAAA